MNAEATLNVTPPQRVAIFWGGGLGDVLVLRPLLLALQATLERPPALFTTASHLPHLLAELGLSTELHILPRQPRDAIGMLRQEQHKFDLLYLGAYPTLRTRLLAKTACASRIWQERHPEVSSFVGEQVLADVRAFGLKGSADIQRPYGGGWDTGAHTAARADASYLVLHPGAKEGWKTKQWPDAHWRKLMQHVLVETRLGLLLVGVGAESSQLDALRAATDTAEQKRVDILTDAPLRILAQRLQGSAGVICHNSGIMHLAAMLGIPTLALTGSSAEFWRPPYAHVTNVSSGACHLACNQYRCPVPFFHAKCIRDLKVEDVMRVVHSKLLTPNT